MLILRFYATNKHKCRYHEGLSAEEALVRDSHVLLVTPLVLDIAGRYKVYILFFR